MSTPTTVTTFATYPIGPNGCDEVSIELNEIASFRGHRKTFRGTSTTPTTTEDCTLVTLKSGVTHDVKVAKAEFELRMHAAMAETARILAGETR